MMKKKKKKEALSEQKPAPCRLANTCGKALNPTYPAICHGLNVVFPSCGDNLTSLSDKFEKIKGTCYVNTENLLTLKGLTFSVP